MQLAKVYVRLGGDTRQVVPKEGVTPAEVVVLKHIHGGQQAIGKVLLTGETAVDDARELRRLRQNYTSPNCQKFLGEAFPGLDPKLPQTFSDIGVRLAKEDDEVAEEVESEYVPDHADQDVPAPEDNLTDEVPQETERPRRGRPRKEPVEV